MSTTERVLEVICLSQRHDANYSRARLFREHNLFFSRTNAVAKKLES